MCGMRRTPHILYEQTLTDPRAKSPSRLGESLSTIRAAPRERRICIRAFFTARLRGEIFRPRRPPRTDYSLSCHRNKWGISVRYSAHSAVNSRALWRGHDLHAMAMCRLWGAADFSEIGTSSCGRMGPSCHPQFMDSSTYIMNIIYIR